MKKIIALALLSSLGLSYLPTHAQSPTPAKLPLFVLAPPNADHKGLALRELFEHPDDWKQTRAITNELLYADWPFKEFSDADLTKWFAQLKSWNIPLQLEVGAVKEWGKTGMIAFNHDQPGWDRINRLGGNIASIAMDEPLICTIKRLHLTDDYAATETANFIALVRQKFPTMQVGDIETYPSLTVEQNEAWINLLQKKLADKGVKGLDFYRIDVNWAAFQIAHGSWKDLTRLEDYCHQVGLPFSLIYWAADYPIYKKKGTATDAHWTNGIMSEGQGYADAGGKPDQFVDESWVGAPSHAVPETSPDTFTGSAIDFYHKFADPSNLSIQNP
jgi:hypothetical protein